MLCEPASKIFELPFKPLHFAYTGVEVMYWKNLCRFQQAQEVHTQMRSPIFLQSHIIEESSRILGLHF